MPQEKTPEQTPKPKSRNTPVSQDAKQTKAIIQTEEQPKCHIHDKVNDFEVDYIRDEVCINDEPLASFEDKHYCLFHFPAINKDVEKFEEYFRTRLKTVEEKLAAIEELAEEERKNAKYGISYDFRYVWFPSEVSLINYKFSAFALFKQATFSDFALFNKATFSDFTDFSWATFSAVAYFPETTFSTGADFALVTFSNVAYFRDATFSAAAFFNEATFFAAAFFNEATFSDEASFNKATFSAITQFNSATFSDVADFNSATFSAKTYFNKTKFAEVGDTQFTEANFAKDVFFDETEFRNEVYFNAVIFEEDSDVFFRDAFFAKNVNFQYCTAEGYLRFSKLRGNDYQFDFQEAAFEKASRISFHTARLCPSWFVNVDARKFVFTDIRWQNLSSDFKNKNIEAELDNLKAREMEEQNKRLLEIAARQLAVNSEENNRYEEAAKFRYMAMETRRLEELKQFSFSRYLIWLYKWTSGYGESWSWAAFVLIAVLFFFGLLYATPFAEFDYGEKANGNISVNINNLGDWAKKNDARFHNMNIGEGLVHSLYVAALQRPEPKPETTLTRLFIILETIFAPLQAALLALAIRRKFMR